jgi:peroxiredoxin
VIAAGEPAPNPTLLAAPGETVRLHELTPPGEGILLLFYLFDWSATCTDELLMLRERREDLEAAGYSPFGVSRDSPWSHVAWREALDLEIPLLCDWEAEAIRAFDIAHEFRGLSDVAQRSCFLVDGDRTVRWTRLYAPGEVPDMDEMVAAARVHGS